MTHPANAYANPSPEPRLSELDELPSEARSTLASLGISTQRQLASSLKNPSVAPHLRGLVDLPESVVAHITERPVRARSAAALETALSAAEEGIDPVPAASFGALRPAAKMQSAMLSLPMAATSAAPPLLPASVNLVPRMPPIGNQQDRGTCVAFAETALHAFALGSTLDLSEQHLYFEAKQVDGIPTACGTFLSSAAQVLTGVGQCSETVWRYRNSLTCNDHGTMPPNARSDAATRKVGLRPLNPTDVFGMKTELAADRPVAFSIPVFNSWSQSPATWDSGSITMPIPGETSASGHAMVLVGYQDVPSGEDIPPGGGFFIVRNSWDTRWGRNCTFSAGHGMIPYAYIAAYTWEAYTLS
jgi:hypothetical protein